ncbi:MAG: putative ABC transporter, ATP-binding protein [Candidatus Nomurabacteria bacterium GW2011_GWA1_37_20]|uniref:Putative ABC transporter, ATP-binding protein n=2 Tax=Parcubacteria group TaxID=1794811 RepID=A0A0G0KFD1_9BACT|nr:MAG: putative ABC transporter, ATP-binding protein [Candidatus Nomurabacteria bacterium GW2011_GWA1_37_20]KKQ47884.1 MAG: putative ABC transporter, ATP-binding protein [Candidatus Yanofskybacteria bacterium GW2011_GWC2_37_9]
MIEVQKLKKSFKDGESTTEVLKGIDFVAKSGEFIAIMGRSGAGKSTFLYQMSLLDEPTEGIIFIDKINTQTLSTNEKTDFRLSLFGYIFQDYALLPEMTALENVALPLLMQNIKEKEALAKASDALIKVGLGKRLDNLPSQLSGGEQQRVSIARAIAHEPKILFADEPTANLDNESSRVIMEIFRDLHRKGQTIIMVTHEEEFSKNAERIVHLDDGRIVKEIIQKPQ